MRLLTHNMLQCPRTRAYPLQLEIETCDEVEVEYSAAFVKRMLPRLDWAVFLDAARQLPDANMVRLLPSAPPDDGDDQVLRAVHRALLQWHVVEGSLRPEGPEGPQYRVSNGVPNLVITEVRKEEGGAKDAEDGDDAMEEDNSDAGPADGVNE